jgi:mannosyltransferase OCH1-like enzyme
VRRRRAGSWQRNHPGWTYRLWTDDSNRELVANHFPWLRHAYERLPAEIQRADLARYLYMFRYGGIYADLDTWCLRDNSNITGGGALTVAEMGNDKEMGHNIPVRLGHTAD